MTLDELTIAYKKTRRVIRSCRTIRQWESARIYTQFFLNHVPPLLSMSIGIELTEVLQFQKQLIRFKYGRL